jgi:tetratricopeptide (TPR) repeat protein/transglutaminase-like putative cysteine protease
LDVQSLTLMFLKQWFAALLFLAVAPHPAPAQQAVPVKQLPAPPDFSKEAYVVEHLSNVLREENDGTGTRETKAEIKVLAEAGVKAFAVLNFTYSSANESVDIDYVRVQKPDGTVVKTPDYNIQDMPGAVTREAPLYSDIHEKHVAVKGLSVGDVLEYLVRYRVFKPEVPGHFWYEYSFAKRLICRDERLEINVPGGKYVKVVSPEFKPDISEEGGRKIYRWTHANLIVKEKAADEIPSRIPPNPDVQLTTFANWEEVGRWYGGLQKEPLQATQAIQSKAAELTKGLKTDDEKVRAIYSFVSLKFHYIGLDFGIGRYQPHAADDVLDNGYGDCKDKHTLMASLLSAAGIEAWPALIHVTRKLDPEVPSPAQFDHVITVVPQGGKLIWLDTTPEVAPYGLLMLNLRGKQALVIPANKPATLQTTPEDTPAPQLQSFTMEGKLGGDGTFTGHAEQSYQGDVEVALRASFRQVPQSQWKEAVQRFSYGLRFSGTVSNVNVSQPDDVGKPFQLSYDYERKEYTDWKDRQITPPMPPMGVESDKDTKKPPDPVQLGALGEVVYRAKLTLPPGYAADAQPAVDLVRPYAEYHAAYSIKDGVLSATRRLVVKKHEIDLSSWEDFRDFGKAISDDEDKYTQLRGGSTVSGSNSGNADALFREGADAFRQRDTLRAQESFEKVIALDPKYKGAHFNLALALAARNKTAEALEQFHKEEELSPDDTRSYQAAATYLKYAGRRDEAVAEWRKFLKIDPGNIAAASTLAQLLYASGKYAEAVPVLEAALKTSPDSYDLELQLGQAYFKTGQTDKAVERFKDAVSKKGNDPGTLNDVAYTLAENKIDLDLAKQYAEKAVEELDSESQGSESSNDAELSLTFQLARVWDTLGWIYFRQGDAKRAETLVRPAWLLGEDSVVGEHLGEIYERQGKAQQAARAYEFALTVASMPATTFGTSIDAANAYRSQNEDIRAHYKKLTGRDAPLTEIKRLPNGEWSKTPAEQLLQTREIRLKNEDKLGGAAEFLVTFKPGKVTSVEYFSGDNDLEELTDDLKAAHYPLEFPPDSGAILMMRISVKCESSSSCVARLVNPVASPMQLRLPVN